MVYLKKDLLKDLHNVQIARNEFNQSLDNFWQDLCETETFNKQLIKLN